MKHFLTILMLACSYILCGAQATSLTVDNQTPGWLSSKINYGDQLTVENLKITGYLNGKDFLFIKELNKKSLTGVIDLSDASIASGTEGKRTFDNTLNDELFAMSERTKKIILPKSVITSDPSIGGSYYDRFYYNVDTIIADCPNLEKIGPFYGTKYLYIGEGTQTIYLGYVFRGDYHHKVILPSTTTDLGADSSPSEEDTIISKIIHPEVLPKTAYFTNYWNKGIVIVPKGTKSAYYKSIFANMTIIENIPVSSLSLDITQKDLKIGKSFKLNATIYPSDANNKAIVWTSSNDRIVTTDANGLITAISYGEATITASSVDNPDIKDECIIKVIEPVTGITLNKNSLELLEDGSEQLFATIFPDKASNKSVSWRSLDINIATVSINGSVVGIKAGCTTIAATTEDGGFEALCRVKVKAKTVTATGLNLSTNSETILIGEKLQLSASISPENASNKGIAWTSTDANIASVNASGLVSALSEGETKIIATTTDGSNISAVCDIKVEKQLILASQIQINPTSVKLNTGESKVLTAIITPEEASSKEIQWSSTAPSVATISQDGEVYAVAEGEAIIVASTKDGSNLSASCSVTVATISGIESIAGFRDSAVKVFSINGYLLHEGKYSDAKLTPGIYIIVYNGKSYKIKVE